MRAVCGAPRGPAVLQQSSGGGGGEGQRPVNGRGRAARGGERATEQLNTYECVQAVKKLLGRFSELQFFLGESGDMEGSMVYAYYKEGCSEPTFLFFKDALKGYKV